MRPLLIDKKVQKELRHLRAYVDENPFTMEEMLQVSKGEMDAAGDRILHRVFIDKGYKVVASREQQKQGDLYHLSVSVDKQEKLPSPDAVSMILMEMKLPPLVDDWVKVTNEDLGDGYEAINIWIKV